MNEVDASLPSLLRPSHTQKGTSHDLSSVSELSELQGTGLSPNGSAYWAWASLRGIAISFSNQPCLGQIVRMATRNLRVTKWLGTIPAVGICTFCNRQFVVPMAALRRVGDAQESLRIQFNEHKCKREDASW